MLQPGTQIGRYEIQRRLGRGGMGTVYVAHDPVLGRMVAIKVFLGDLDLPDASDRFAREARSAAALNHANIVTVHDYGDVDSQPYIVMEYVQGETLASLIKRKAPIAPAEKLRWLEELCVGVAYAHRIGVIHRDIKPTNLMIDRSGRLKILDFGIARMLGTLSSGATAFIGTPGYMAPEQIMGGTIDYRSDLFSIGVVGYELFSYTEAFPGDTVPAITHRILSEDPIPLTERSPELSPELAAVIERALKKSAQERFPDAQSLAIAFGRVRRQLGGAPVDDLSSTLPSRASNTPAPRVSNAGTDPDRVSASMAVTQLPTPEPPRIGREELVRRRTQQIEGSLEQARTLLQQGELEAALDACMQALTFDDTHEGALALEQTIKAASVKRRASALVQEARQELERGALTVAQDLLQQARALDSEAPNAKRLERDLRLARVEQERLRQRAETLSKTLEAAERALERSEVESALALAREALALDKGSDKARRIEAEAVRRLDVGTDSVKLEPLSAIIPPTVLAPSAVARQGKGGEPPDLTVAPTVVVPLKAPAPAPRKSARVAWVAENLQGTLSTLRSSVTSIQTLVATRPKREKQIIGWSIVGILIVVAGVAAMVWRPRPAPPTGTLVLEAVPWATIAAIEAEDGTPLPLPSPASTPLALDLPTGTYRIRILGPPPDSESRVITAQVQTGTVVTMPVAQFKMLTPEEYFEPYLTSPTSGPASETVPAEPGADPSPPTSAPKAAR